MTDKIYTVYMGSSEQNAPERDVQVLISAICYKAFDMKIRLHNLEIGEALTLADGIVAERIK